MSTLTETLKSNLDNPASSVEFDLHAALDVVLGGVGLTASDSGGKITFYGKDPIVPSRLRFGSGARTPAFLILLSSSFSLQTS